MHHTDVTDLMQRYIFYIKQANISGTKCSDRPETVGIVPGYRLLVSLFCPSAENVTPSAYNNYQNRRIPPHVREKPFAKSPESRIFALEIKKQLIINIKNIYDYEKGSLHISNDADNAHR